jgi:integrase
MKKTRYPGVYEIHGGYRIRTVVQDPRTGKWVERDRILKGATLKEAVARREELRLRDLAERSRDPAKLTLTVFAKSWFEQKLPNWKRSTRERVLSSLEFHILPFLGGTYVEQIRRGDVEAWKARMTTRKGPSGNTYATRTINGWLRVLLIMLRDAVVDLDLGHDPTLRVKELPERDTYLRDPNCLSREELPRFLEMFQKMYSRFYPIVLLGVFTGARWGELTAITFADVDEKGRRILLTKAHYHGTLSTTKTGKVRVVPVTDAVLEVLRQHRESLKARGMRVGQNDLVFPADDGGYHHCSLLSGPFKRVMKRMGIQRRLTPHGMRRTFNNLMRQVENDKVVIQSMTGHSDDRMTEHYSHVSLDEKRSALDRLVEYVGAGAKEGASGTSFGAPLGDPLGDRLPVVSTDRKPPLVN